MAVASSAMTATATITPPASSHGEMNHGENHHWGYSEHKPHDQNDDDYHEMAAGYQNDGSRSARKMPSADNLGRGRWDHNTDPNVMSPPIGHDMKMDRSSSVDAAGRARRSNDEHGRPQGTDMEDEHSKWIHRDKLAKIESEELQAAGIFLPKTRATSKQRRDRDRSQSRLRRGTDASEQSHSRSRKNSLAVEQRNAESASQTWDLRTPEEIAEEEADAYFTNGPVKGGSRIPVAKTSPAPIPLDYLERANPAARRWPDSPEDESISYPVKPRSRSASASIGDADLASSANGAKLPALDSSPKKNANGARKASGPKPAQGRPKTRSGRDSSANSGTRPSTRSGDLSGAKSPEGDPPWIVSAYKPDPRLPPDQQLLPTVARRLQQEKWEKEGKFGDAYDKDFRPLNDNAFLKPPEHEKSPSEENQQDEWPLSPKSPRQGSSYSTMPKINDLAAGSPLASPRTPTAPLQKVPTQQAQPTPTVQEDTPATAQENEPKDSGGCGCCVVM